MKTKPAIVAFLILLVVLSLVNSGCLPQRESTTLDASRKDAMMVQGAKAYLAGDLSGAIVAKQEVVRLDPSDTYAQYDLAMTLHKAGRTTEAIPILQQVAVSNDKDMSGVAKKRLSELTRH